jgi:hypothetical protein
VYITPTGAAKSCVLGRLHLDSTSKIDILDGNPGTPIN